MRVEISIGHDAIGDMRMFIELQARVPALRNSLHRAVDGGYVLQAEGDHARYLLALIIERLTGAETYEEWLARNTGKNPALELLRACIEAPTPTPRSLGDR